MDTSTESEGAGRKLDSVMAAWNRLPDYTFNKVTLDLAQEVVTLMGDLDMFADLKAFVSPLGPDMVAALRQTPGPFFTLANMHLHYNEYHIVYNMIRSSDPLLDNNKEALVNLWDRTLYKETERNTGHQLNPLHRFRLRQRNPPPDHLLPLGNRATNALPEAATRALWSWAMTHAYKLYPNRAQKERLVAQTGLTIEQVGMWFSNVRRRVKKVGLRAFFEKKKKRLRLNEEIQYTAPRERASSAPPPPDWDIPSPLSQSGILNSSDNTGAANQSGSIVHETTHSGVPTTVDRMLRRRPEFDIMKWPPSSTETSITPNYMPDLIHREPDLRLPDTSPSPLVPDYNPTNQPTFGPLPGVLPFDINPAMSYYNPCTYTNSYSQPLHPAMTPTNPLPPYFTPEHTFCCQPYYGMDFYQGYLEVPKPVTAGIANNFCSQAHCNFINNNFSQVHNASCSSSNYEHEINSFCQGQSNMLNNQISLGHAGRTSRKRLLDIECGQSGQNPLEKESATTVPSQPTYRQCATSSVLPAKKIPAKINMQSTASNVFPQVRQPEAAASKATSPSVGESVSTDQDCTLNGPTTQKEEYMSKPKPSYTDPLGTENSSSETVSKSLPSSDFLNAILQDSGKLNVVDENNNDISGTDVPSIEFNTTSSSEEAFKHCPETSPTPTHLSQLYVTESETGTERQKALSPDKLAKLLLTNRENPGLSAERNTSSTPIQPSHLMGTQVETAETGAGGPQDPTPNEPAVLLFPEDGNTGPVDERPSTPTQMCINDETAGAERQLSLTPNQPAQVLFTEGGTEGSAAERQVSERGGILHLSPQESNKADVRVRRSWATPASSLPGTLQGPGESVYTSIKMVRPPQLAITTRKKAQHASSAVPRPYSTGCTDSGENALSGLLAASAIPPHTTKRDTASAPPTNLMPQPPYGPLPPLVSSQFVGPYHSQVWSQTALMSGLPGPPSHWPPPMGAYYGTTQLRSTSDVLVPPAVPTPYWPYPAPPHSTTTTSSGGSQCSSSPPGSATPNTSPSQRPTESEVVEALLNLSHYSL